MKRATPAPPSPSPLRHSRRVGAKSRTSDKKGNNKGSGAGRRLPTPNRSQNEENILRRVYREKLMQRAVEVFACGYSDDQVLAARDSEIARIRGTIESVPKSGRSAILFLSGTPGTGKTSAVRCVLKDLQSADDPKFQRHSFVNCAYNATPSDIFRDVVNLTLPQDSTTLVKSLQEIFQERGLRAALDCLAQKARKHNELLSAHGDCPVLVLDEADRLSVSSASQRGGGSALRRSRTGSGDESSFLSQLLDHAWLCHIKIAILVISNTNALSDSLIASSLGKRSDKTPQASSSSRPSFSSLLFSAYTTQQFIDIVRTRIRCAERVALRDAITEVESSRGGGSQQTAGTGGLERVARQLEGSGAGLFDENALFLTASKVAAYAGDCRQLLDVCRQLLTSRFDEALSKPPADARSDSSSTTAETADWREKRLDAAGGVSVAPAPPSFPHVISLRDAAQVLPKTTGTASGALARLPLHQQILTCVLCQQTTRLATAPTPDPSNNVAPRRPISIRESQLHTCYLQFCKNYQIDCQYQSSDHFRGGLLSLADSGIVELLEADLTVTKRVGVGGRKVLPNSRRTDRRVAFPLPTLASDVYGGSGGRLVRLKLALDEASAALSSLKKIFATTLGGR